jgi:opacity protein-like surface antigen
VQAADLTSGGSLKDGINPFASAFNWNGFYVEIGAGYGFDEVKSSLFGNSVNLAATGGIADFRLGYDYQFAKAGLGSLVVGPYGEIGNAFDINTSAKLSSNSITFGNRWEYGGGAKAGYDYGTGQIYGILGYAHQDVSLSKFGTGLDGLKYGVGIQMKIFGPHVYAGLEITRTDFNTFTTPSQITVSPVQDAVMLKIGIH